MEVKKSNEDDNVPKDVKKDAKSANSTLDERPKNVNPRMWEKFQSLKQKREAIAKRNADRRLKQQKKQIQDQKEADIKAEKPKEQENTERVAEMASTSSEKTWAEVRGYMHCNDHIRGIDKGRYAEKGQLEKKIDEAVKNKDFDTAEKLSDTIATNEFGKVVTEAIDAKTWTEKRKREEDMKKAKKKKKLAWGFDHKERWESKCNM